MLTKAIDKGKKIKKIKNELHGHAASGRYVKSFVYGGLDGIITTFAVVAGVAGASLSSSIVLILGFANLVADGISMAFGDYLSTKAEGEYGRRERGKEEEHMKKSPRQRKNELVDIYLSQGFSGKDAERLAGVVCKNKKACVDIMLSYELGITRKKNEPVKNAVTTFTSFVLFGFVPLIAYVFSRLVSFFGQYTFEVAAVFTGLTLFTLGAVKCKITGRRWFFSGAEMLLIGGLAAVAAFFIGRFISGIV